MYIISMARKFYLILCFHDNSSSLFQKCFDHKPRMISKRNKDNSTSCSHPVTKHEFEDNKYVGSF